MFASRSAVAILGSAAALESYSGYTFEKYVSDFGKTYTSDWAQRELIFQKNLADIQAHNQLYLSNRSTWYMAINQFADLTLDEFREHLKLNKDHGSTSHIDVAEAFHGANPERIDWREQKVVTPAKDQGGCGSCWAFAAAELVESHHALASGELLELSPQAYLNCVKNPSQCGGSGGCDGATAELALELTQSKGVPLESSLPYTAKQQRCSSYSAAVKVSGYNKLPSNDAAAVETALATQGPLAISAAASMWQLYGGGIFDRCTNDPILPQMGAELNHAVVMVGYGVENGEGYWLIRNSWGADYGENGYIRVTRKNDAETYVDDRPEKGEACKPYPSSQIVGGECGVLFSAIYPTGAGVVDLSV